MLRCLSKIPVVAVCVLLFGACSITRYIPDGEYLLKKNEIEPDRRLSKQERIAPEELEPYLKQSPNKRFLGMYLSVWMYATADSTKNNAWNRFKRKVGQEPVLVSAGEIDKSLANLKTYMDSRGFFDSRVEAVVDTLPRKRAVVKYVSDQGEPYRISTFGYEFRDPFVGNVILRDTASSLVRVGEVFDIGVLDRERSRITDYLKDRGYYNFSVNNISYDVDTTAGGHTAAVKMVVKRHLAGYDQQGAPIYDNNTVYRIGDVSIFPGYNPSVSLTDSTFRSRLDTLDFHGLHVVYEKLKPRSRPRVRRKVLGKVVQLYPNAVYDAGKVQQTYDAIMGMGYFRSAGIVFTAREADDQNLINYVGGTELPGSDRVTEERIAEYVPGSGPTTREGYLDCSILCTPALRQSYSIALQASTTSSYNGINATLSYQNRNMLRGVELFDVSLTTGYEFYNKGRKKTAFEIGGSVSVTFPRFITPVKVNRRNLALSPQTRVELSINSQRRPYYHRVLSSASWGYSWRNRRNSTFVLRPIDVNLVKLNYRDEQFFDSIANPYLRNSYTEQIIAGISGSYLYRNAQRSRTGNELAFRLNWETRGNLIDALSHWLAKPSYDKNGDKYYKLFGIRYAQYFRLDASLSNNVMVSEKSSVAYRLYAGGGLSYGNSNSIPFDRLFFAGGSNSMRGWQVRTLGPGTVLRPDSAYPTQLGNFRLEANLEMRFPVWGIFHGALFFDVGNIWFLKSNPAEYESEAVFKLNRFYKQLGFNTGLGLRLDIKYAILRFDWGIRLHDPNLPAGHRWIENFRFKNTALHVGVGYPF